MKISTDKYYKQLQSAGLSQAQMLKVIKASNDFFNQRIVNDEEATAIIYEAWKRGWSRDK